MKKSIMALILSICIIINFFPVQVLAVEESMLEEPASENKYIDIGAYVIGNNITINQLLAQSKFTASQGHGFAAEVGNNLIDRLKGENAKVVGNDNVKNGADRLIIGRDGTRIWIQDKYYSTASGSIGACFEDGVFRYLDADGNPMQIEVPKDQYDDAVLLMRKRIENGQLKNAGITNPDDAENLVRKGHLTYKQAVNLAKAGTVESLKFDVKKGTVSAGCAFGISSVIVYSVSRLNGASPEESLKVSAIEGLKTGGTVFGTYVISSQLARTNITKAFVPSSEALVKALGDDFATALLNSAGQQTVGLTDDAIRSQAAKIIRNQGLTSAVTIAILTTGDVVEIVRGRISAEQLLKNLAVTTAGVIGGSAGSALGGAAGTFVAPGPGTTAGSIIGGVVVGGAAGYGAEKILGIFVKDDAEKMMEIIEDGFLQLAQDYLLNEEEANRIVAALQEELTGENLKNMFASKNQEEYAQDMIEPLVITEVSNRKPIKVPTEAEMRAELKATLKDVVFIH